MFAFRKYYRLKSDRRRMIRWASAGPSQTPLTSATCSGTLMFTTLTNGGPLAELRWSATTTMMGKNRAGDQAHVAASGRERPSCQSGGALDHESRLDILGRRAGCMGLNF